MKEKTACSFLTLVCVCLRPCLRGCVRHFSIMRGGRARFGEAEVSSRGACDVPGRQDLFGVGVGRREKWREKLREKLRKKCREKCCEVFVKFFKSGILFKLI